MVCGPKSTGKSTFSRLLVNSFLSRAFTQSGVGFLDLDPGQPEYSPPGEVSLLRLKNFNFGPPFTHPMVVEKYGDLLIRSHHLGASSPKDDILHYLGCAINLLDTYHRSSRIDQYPLVINCSGWTQGAGTEALEAILQSGGITNVVFMGASGSEQPTDTLYRRAEVVGAAFHSLSAQPSDLTTRTAAESRMMQTLSYFHLDSPERNNIHWDQTPLYIKKPIYLSYAATSQDIEGVLLLGEEINPDMLANVINGSVLALVTIEDKSELSCYMRYSKTAGEVPTDPVSPGVSIWQATEGNLAEVSGQEYGTEGMHDHNIRAKQSSRLSREGMPYLFNGTGTNTPLDPYKSRSIGQVLIRSIDKRNRRLEVLTPLSKTTILSYRAKGMPLVLVQGKLDTPGWSYQEEYFWAVAMQNERARSLGYKKELELLGDSDADGDEGMVFNVDAWAARTPWVELVKHNLGNKRNDRIWKVRRNLQIKNKK